MASEKIEFEDIFGKGFNKKLDDTIKGFEDLLELNSKMLKQSKKEPKTAENIEKITKSVNESKAAIEGLTELQKQRLKIEKRLIDAAEDGAVENEKLNVQLQNQKKANKELAKEQLGLVSVYDKQSKKLNKLRKEYKNLVLVEGKATKATKKLEKEITKLDKELKEVDAAAGQFQRNVGNYPDTLGKASKSILVAAASAVTLKGAFDGVKGSLENSVEGTGAVAELGASVSGLWDQVSNTVASAVLDVVDYGKAVNENIQNGDDFLDAFDGNEAEGNWNRTSEATENFNDKVGESIDGYKALGESTRAWANEIRPLEQKIIVLNGLVAEQQIIAGDGTRSFTEINDAILKGQELQISSARISIKIAAKEKEIIDEQIRIRNLAGGASVDLLDEQSEATNKLKEAQIALNIELFENEKEIRQVKQDLLEKDLDILIDGFDNQKTINERKIADERKTLEEKRKIFNETKVLADESFLAQKEVLGQLSDAGIDVDELLSLDAVTLNKRIRELEQSEIIEGRTLEVIRERRTVLQDIEDIEIDLTAIKTEQLNNIALSEQTIQQENFDLKRELLDKELNDVKTTAERKKKIREDIEGTSIEQLTDQAEFDKELATQDIINLEERAAKVKEIENKLKNDIVRLKLDGISEAEQAEIDSLNKRRDAIFDFAKEVTGELSNALDERFDDRNKDNEKEIDEREKSIETQQELAEKGIDNQLAFEEKKLAEANLKEKQELEKQAKIKEGILLAEAYLVAYQARLKDDANTAGFRALSDVLLAKGIGKTLAAGFEEGGYTSDVGTSTIAGVVHGQEFVIDAATTKQMGLKGSSMGDFKNKMFSGQLFNHDFITSDMSKAQAYDNTRVVNAVESLENTIKSQPIQQVNVDGLGNLLEIVYKDGIKTVTTHKNKSRRL